MIDLDAGPCIVKRVSGCGVGTEYMAVTPTGELYPCHQFVGDEKFLLGDIWKGVTNKKFLNNLKNAMFIRTKSAKIALQSFIVPAVAPQMLITQQEA